DAEVQNLVPELAERGGGGSAGEPRPDHDEGEFRLVGGVDQLHREFVPVPLVGDRAGRGIAFQRHRVTCPIWRTYVHTAIIMNAAAIATATTLPAASSRGVHRG